MKTLLLTTLVLSTTSFTPSPRPSFFKSSTLSAKKIAFSKYHGLGNDFILINNLSSSSPPLTPSESSSLCDRNFGIGADGVIFASKSEEEGYDLKMTIYNSDGTEPEMCGNGIRTLAQFLVDESEGEGKMPTLPITYNIETLAGPILPQVFPSRNIEVDMGYPIFKASEIPTTLPGNVEDGSVIDSEIVLDSGKSFKATLVSMGNPHCVIFTSDDVISDADLLSFGGELESHSVFPANTNVEFVHVESDDHLRMKVYERGAGPTLACGTGACALVIAAVRSGRIPTAKDGVKVTLPGGDLVIKWGGMGEKVYMTGPAVLAFKGEVEV